MEEKLKDLGLQAKIVPNVRLPPCLLDGRRSADAIGYHLLVQTPPDDPYADVGYGEPDYGLFHADDGLFGEDDYGYGGGRGGGDGDYAHRLAKQREMQRLQEYQQQVRLQQQQFGHPGLHGRSATLDGRSRRSQEPLYE